MDHFIKLISVTSFNTGNRIDEIANHVVVLILIQTKDLIVAEACLHKSSCKSSVTIWKLYTICIWKVVNKDVAFQQLSNGTTPYAFAVKSLDMNYMIIWCMVCFFCHIRLPWNCHELSWKYHKTKVFFQSVLSKQSSSRSLCSDIIWHSYFYTKYCNTLHYKLNNMAMNKQLWSEFLVLSCTYLIPFMYFRMCLDPENIGKISFLCWVNIRYKNKQSYIVHVSWALKGWSSLYSIVMEK